MRKMIGLIGCALFMCAQAFEHRIVMQTGWMHSNWLEATSAGVDTTDSSGGRYQWSGGGSWYTLVSPYLFSGFYLQYAQAAKLSIEKQTYALYRKHYGVMTGLRYASHQQETRFWWGFARRLVNNDLPDWPLLSDWSLEWGVSYGREHPGGAWHWGVLMSPGFYDYQQNIQIPTAITTYVSYEWVIA